MSDDTAPPPRLALRTLGRLPPDVVRPGYDPMEVGVGIVHLGIGAFHRAHQAVYNEDILNLDLGGWAVCGVAQTRPLALEQLGPQDGLFTVLTRAAGTTDAQVIGAVREVLDAQLEPEAVRERLAHNDVHVVTITVTEKGYRADIAQRRLALDDAALQRDLADTWPHRTVLGQLASGFAERCRSDAGPVTVLSCDNLPGNGRLLRGLLDEFCSRALLPDAPAVRRWISEHVTFPDTVVDRIVPATTTEDLMEAKHRLRLVDRATVTAEPFRQWVIEDTFAAAHPPWERVGATITADVKPFQQAKLRLLNGAHSLLAYLVGAERDITVSEAVADEGIVSVLRRYLNEATGTLDDAPPELDGYAEAVLERFANPSIRHRVEQIGRDGSKKLPQRIVPVARSLAASGIEPTWSALGLAAWIRYLRMAADRGDVVADPAGARLAELASGGPAEAVVGRLLAVAGVDVELAADDVFRGAVERWLGDLERHGTEAAIRAAEAS